MKKILVISGSPRKGDSYRVVKLIEKQMHELGDVELEYLILRKCNIEYRFFNKLKTKITMHKSRFPADYEYWQEMGWLDTDYFFPANFNAVQKAIGGLPVKLIKKMLRKKLGDAVYQKFIGQGSESA